MPDSAISFNWDIQLLRKIRHLLLDDSKWEDKCQNLEEMVKDEVYYEKSVDIFRSGTEAKVVEAIQLAEEITTLLAFFQQDPANISLIDNADSWLQLNLSRAIRRKIGEPGNAASKVFYYPITFLLEKLHQRDDLVSATEIHRLLHQEIERQRIDLLSSPNAQHSVADLLEKRLSIYEVVRIDSSGSRGPEEVFSGQLDRLLFSSIADSEILICDRTLGHLMKFIYIDQNKIVRVLFEYDLNKTRAHNAMEKICKYLIARPIECGVISVGAEDLGVHDNDRDLFNNGRHGLMAGLNALNIQAIDVQVSERKRSVSDARYEIRIVRPVIIINPPRISAKVQR